MDAEPSCREETLYAEALCKVCGRRPASMSKPTSWYRCSSAVGRSARKRSQTVRPSVRSKVRRSGAFRTSKFDGGSDWSSDSASRRRYDTLSLGRTSWRSIHRTWGTPAVPIAASADTMIVELACSRRAIRLREATAEGCAWSQLDETHARSKRDLAGSPRVTSAVVPMRARTAYSRCSSSSSSQAMYIPRICFSSSRAAVPSPHPARRTAAGGRCSALLTQWCIANRATRWCS